MATNVIMRYLFYARKRSKIRTLRDSLIARKRRHGRGLPGARQQPQPESRAQDSARKICRRPRPSAAFRARSGNGFGAESSEYSHGLRVRQSGRLAFYHDRIRRRRNSARKTKARKIEPDRDFGRRRANRFGSGGGASAGSYSSRRKAGKHYAARGRLGQSARFRTGEIYPKGRKKENPTRTPKRSLT